MKKALKIIALVVGILLLAMVVGFLIWTSDYYHAEEEALAVLENHPNLEQVDNLTILTPEGGSDTALIFYPGALVEAVAYLPILENISDTCGITCILVEMPFNLAFFGANAAEDIIEDYGDQYESFYIGGHSLGGGMASSFASDNPELVDGLILMGAYIYGDYSDENALTIYGTFNDNLEESMDYTENIVIIDGGNHAQFGNYGKQDGDPDATITPEEQQEIAVMAIAEFLESY